MVMSISLFNRQTMAVGVWGCGNSDYINNPAYAEKSACEEVEDTHTCFTCIEAMSAEHAENNTQNQCHTFIFRTAQLMMRYSRSGRGRHILLIIDYILNNNGLLFGFVFGIFKFGHTVRAKSVFFADICTAIFTYHR